jgi:hypothetical protein
MTENVTPPAPAPAADAALAAKVDELSKRLAGAADPEMKQFLAGVLKAGETTLAEVKSLGERLAAAEAKAGEAAEKAISASRNAAVKEAAKLAGAVDAGDVLALLNMADVKIEDGVSNVADLVEGLKKAKPHLFKTGSAASTTTAAAAAPAATTPANKMASAMTPEERAAALRAMGVNSARLRAK